MTPAMWQPLSRPTIASTRAFAVLVYLALLAVSQPVAAQTTPSESAEPRPTFEVSPRAYIQLDWRGYPDWTIEPGGGRLPFDTFEVRRARLGVDGRWRRLSFEAAFDPQDLDDDAVVKDLYGQLRVSKALRIRFGQFKLPGGSEYGTSASSLDFMERSAVSSSADVGRDLGGMVIGALGERIEYQVGLFAGDGGGRPSRAGVTTATRVSWAGPNDLDVGFISSVGRTRSHDSDPANGIGGRTSSGYEFFDRVYVQGRRMRFGADASYTPGPWKFAVAALRATDQRLEQGLDFEDLPTVAASGWNVSINRTFGRRRGATRVRAREVEAGIRFDRLSFDDTAAPTLRDSVRLRATDVRARSADTATAALSWRPTRWGRVLGSASYERYGDARSAPEAGKQGGYLALGMRFQLELP